jgi:uncharacterized HAD superfamily protein
MTSECKTIYVDLDDVLCHAARHFLLIVERDFGKRIGYEQLTNFDVGHACGLSAAEREELYRIVHRSDELLSMAPMDDAIAVLSNWMTQGYEIAIVTGRPPESAEVSLEWLTKHRIAYHSFTVVDKYARFAVDSPRAISLTELSSRRFCWAVEDSLPMAQYLASRMRVPVALLDRPWNQCSEEGGIVRYHDWVSLEAAGLKLASLIGGRS